MSDADGQETTAKNDGPRAPWVNGSKEPRCDWNALWLEFDTGRYSLADLSKRYGVHKSVIARKAAKLGKANAHRADRQQSIPGKVRAERAKAEKAARHGEQAQQSVESLADQLRAVQGQATGSDSVQATTGNEVAIDGRQSQVVVRDEKTGAALTALKAAVDSTPDAVDCLVAVMNGQISGRWTDQRRKAALNLLEFVTEASKVPVAMQRRLGELSPAELRDLRDLLRGQLSAIDVTPDSKPLTQQPQQSE